MTHQPKFKLRQKVYCFTDNHGTPEFFHGTIKTPGDAEDEYFVVNTKTDEGYLFREDFIRRTFSEIMEFATECYETDLACSLIDLRRLKEEHENAND